MFQIHLKYLEFKLSQVDVMLLTNILWWSMQDVINLSSRQTQKFLKLLGALDINVFFLRYDL